MADKIDVFERYYSFSHLDKSNPYYRAKRVNYLRAKKAYFENEVCVNALPIRATLQTTDFCNLNCIMCQIHSQREKHTFEQMSVGDFDIIAEKLFPTLVEAHPTNIGEPLISPWFSHLVEKCKEYGVLLDITSNGTLLSEERIWEILPCLLDIKISFDGIKKETFERIRKGADYELVVKNIRNFIRIRDSVSSNATITLQMTLFDFNYTEIPEVIRFAHDIGIDRVKAYPVFSYSEQIDNVSLMNCMDSFEKIRKESILLADSLGMPLGIAEPQQKNSGELDGNLIMQKCRLLWAECFIDYDGQIYPCHTHNNISLGNICTQNAKDVWNSRYAEFLRNALVSGKCAKTICDNCGNNFIRTSIEQSVPYNKDDYLFHKTGDKNINWGKRCKQFMLNR